MVVFMGDNWIATEMTSCTKPVVSSVGTTIGAGVTIGATLEGVMDGTAVVVVTFLAMVGATVVATGASVVEGVVTTAGASVVEGVVTTTGDSVVEGVVTTTAGASVVVEGVVTTTAGATLTTGDSVDGSTMFGAAVGGTATTILHWEQSPKTTKVRVKTSAEPSFKQV